jgi:hypothetical protein
LDDYTAALMGIAALRRLGFSDAEIYAMDPNTVMGQGVLGAQPLQRAAGGSAALGPNVASAGVASGYGLGKGQLAEQMSNLEFQKQQALIAEGRNPYNVVGQLEAERQMGTWDPLNQPTVANVPRRYTFTSGPYEQYVKDMLASDTAMPGEVAQGRAAGVSPGQIDQVNNAYLRDPNAAQQFFSQKPEDLARMFSSRAAGGMQHLRGPVVAFDMQGNPVFSAGENGEEGITFTPERGVSRTFGGDRKAALIAEVQQAVGRHDGGGRAGVASYAGGGMAGLSGLRLGSLAGLSGLRAPTGPPSRELPALPTDPTPQDPIDTAGPPMTPTVGNPVGALVRAPDPLQGCNTPMHGLRMRTFAAGGSTGVTGYGGGYKGGLPTTAQMQAHRENALAQARIDRDNQQNLSSVPGNTPESGPTNDAINGVKYASSDPNATAGSLARTFGGSARSNRYESDPYTWNSKGGVQTRTGGANLTPEDALYYQNRHDQIAQGQTGPYDPRTEAPAGYTDPMASGKRTFGPGGSAGRQTGESGVPTGETVTKVSGTGDQAQQDAAKALGGALQTNTLMHPDFIKQLLEGGVPGLTLMTRKAWKSLSASQRAALVGLWTSTGQVGSEADVLETIDNNVPAGVN